ncbi:hypothetical protein IE53DRAFT_212663 [Violaceomyces palustris]|uniref:Uncharacterized protein n=1 Tax=Violaceomyces palustris TaxID=1673888 RepID=A0ACD0NQL0_9BASI|nr:hypothetical protein IE53DRAFT_212663 [Violaceomyces palustris]
MVRLYPFVCFLSVFLSSFSLFPPLGLWLSPLLFFRFWNARSELGGRSSLSVSLFGEPFCLSRGPVDGVRWFRVVERSVWGSWCWMGFG